MDEVGAALRALSSVATGTPSATDNYETLFNGLPQVEQLSYNGDGTLGTRTDANGHTTSFSSYSRGTPQTVRYADNTQESVAVHNIGVITSYTNGAGATTTYGFDQTSFRLTSITPPADNGIAWNPTLIDWEKVQGLEYGLGAGHWRQTISTGRARTITYYDALWQPRVTRIFDADAPNTMFVTRNFDHEGRQVFESYKVAGVTQQGTYVPGVSTVFDAIGRPIRYNADTENGMQPTQINYLSGFRRQVVDPRNNGTITAFQAFDEPTKDSPVMIDAPEDTHTSIQRNNLGLATSMTRWGNTRYAVNATRSYVYDAYRRLCKTVEPESGATIQQMDPVGNVIWRASGQSLTNINGCDHDSVPGNQRTLFGYDAVNRMTYTGFGDGSPSISRKYTPDGQPLTIDTDSINWRMSYYNRGAIKTETLSVDGWNQLIQYNREPNGNVQSIQYPNGVTIDQNPNALGQARTITDITLNRQLAREISYLPNGEAANYTLGNEIAFGHSQLARGMTYQIYIAGVANRTYAYDANKNVVGITDYAGQASASMGYDGLDRLVTATAPGIWGNGSYSYDALDNTRASFVSGRNAEHPPASE